MPGKFECSTCGKVLFVDDEKTNDTYLCQFCGTTCRVPSTVEFASNEEFDNWCNDLGIQEKGWRWRNYDPIKLNEQSVINEEVEKRLHSMRMWNTVPLYIVIAVIWFLFGLVPFVTNDATKETILVEKEGGGYEAVWASVPRDEVPKARIQVVIFTVIISFICLGGIFGVYRRGKNKYVRDNPVAAIIENHVRLLMTAKRSSGTP